MTHPPLDDMPSGRFVLRIEPELHAALRHAARDAGLSLNELCARKLARPSGSLPDPAAEAVERAAAVAEGGLLGVVAFGSWARQEWAAGSDVDLLIVVADDVPLGKALYRRWDTNPVSWAHHPVEPHFVHLPEPGSPPSGLWAEAAVDGIVLFDPALVVSRRLVELRQEIASGRFVRRRIHGQPYWVEVDHHA